MNYQLKLEGGEEGALLFSDLTYPLALSKVSSETNSEMG